ncbi:Uncharacterised protein [uncultured Blautia sp.]|nr:Uncharacterised protein [uncultured Blautia sp.]
MDQLFSTCPLSVCTCPAGQPVDFHTIFHVFRWFIRRSQIKPFTTVNSIQYQRPFLLGKILCADPAFPVFQLSCTATLECIPVFFAGKVQINLLYPVASLETAVSSVSIGWKDITQLNLLRVVCMIAVIQVINQILPDIYQIPFCFLVDHIIFCPCCNDGLLCTIGLSGNTVDLFIGGMDLYLGSKLLIVLYILILSCSLLSDGTVIPDVRKSFVDITYSCTDSQCGSPIWVIRLFYIPCQIAGFVFTLVSRSRVVKLQAALIIMKIFWNGHGDHNIRCLASICYQFMILCSTGDLQPWHYHKVCCTLTVSYIIIGFFPVRAFDQVCILNADSTDQGI